MSLIDQIQQVQDESFEKWFERWYEKKNLEKKIVQAAQEGYTGLKVSIKDYKESESYFNKERIYLNRRLRDKRTVDKIKNQLGEGFAVRHRKQTRIGKLFGVSITSDAEWIDISWEKKVSSI